MTIKYKILIVAGLIIVAMSLAFTALNYATQKHTLLLETAMVSLFGLLLGGSVFVILRVYPLCTLKRAEEALQASEEYFRQLFANSAGAQSIMRNGKFTEFNQAVLDMLGYSRKEELCIVHPSVLSPEKQPDGRLSLEKAEEMMAIALKNGSHRFEWVHTRANGQDFPAEILLTAMPEENGNKIIHAVWTDITERKRARGHLEYRVAVESLLVSLSKRFINIAADELDENITRTLAAVGEFTKVDRSYLFLFSDDGLKMNNTHEWCAPGIEPQIGMLQDLSVDVFPWWMDKLRRYETILIPRVADLPPEANAEKEILQAQAIRSITVVPVVFGTTLAGFMGFDSARAERDWMEEDVDALRLVGDIFANALEHQREEYSLSRQTTLLSTLLNSIPDIVFFKDRQGVYLGCNPPFAELVGQSRNDIIGKTDCDLFDREIADSFRSYDCIVMQENRVQHNEEEVVYPDGRRKQIDTLKAQLIMQDGQSIGLLGISRDITDRKRAEEEKEILQDHLRQAQKMESVGRLAGGVAHDYNNISSVIIGYSELAMEQVEEGSPLHEDLMEIFTAAKRSTDITQQLLAFARKQTVAPKVLDLNYTIGDLLKMLQRLIGEDINLVWIPGVEVRPIKMDPSQINQIMANLCVNARDAIADVGRVTVETKNIDLDEDDFFDHEGPVPGEYIQLSVSDDGCGMTPETRDNIFEPFFTTKDTKGTGLGLSTVYGIVKQNNGFITVYSETEKGTTFRIYLPIYVGQTVKAHSEKTIELPLSRGETVLLVEDDGSILRIVKRILEKLGYAVLFAISPEEAISLASEHADEINLLITDVVMPKMNGRELSERLQSLYPNLKTLFMSGYTADIIAKRGILESGFSFIAKPFSKKDLAFKVREVLDGKKV